MFNMLLVSFEEGIDPLLKIFIFFLLFFMIFFWLSIVIWTINDVLNRTENLLFQIFSVVMVMSFHILGLVIYIIFRPTKTLTEENFDLLEERLLINSIEEQDSCPECEKVINDDFLFCPYCHYKLKKKCQNCGKLLLKKWKYCPFCSKNKADK